MLFFEIMLSVLPDLSSLYAVITPIVHSKNITLYFFSFDSIERPTQRRSWRNSTFDAFHINQSMSVCQTGLLRINFYCIWWNFPFESCCAWVTSTQAACFWVNQSCRKWLLRETNLKQQLLMHISAWLIAFAFASQTQFNSLETACVYKN